MLSGTASFSSSQSSQCFNGSTPLKWKKKASLLTGYNKSKHAHTRSTRSYALIKLPSLSSFSVSKKTPPPPPPLDVAAGLRAAAPFAVPWASLVAYAAFVAPTSPAGFDENLVQQIIAQQGPPTFSGLFNVMGVWPAVYASLLIPSARIVQTDDKRFAPPATPFVAASVAFGAFALLPYLAITKFREAADGAVADEAAWEGRTGGFVAKILESKIQAALLVGAVAACAYQASSGGLAGVEEFKAMFATSKLVNVTSCDCATLSLCAPFWAASDARRRGVDANWPFLLSLLPIMGPAVYLLLRPQLETTAE